MAQPVANALGPSTVDPRSGEILSAHVQIYADILEILETKYFVQAGATDERIGDLPLPDEILGQALRYVTAHEVGHGLGLRHNHRASQVFSVEQLRDPQFTAQYGTSPSIMSYGRFNYIAQPGDGVTEFMPKIGPYDLFAIQWGYRPIPEANSPQDELPTLDAWAARQMKDPYLLYGGEDLASLVDPNVLTENLGAERVEATRLGIKNLERLMPGLIEATTRKGEDSGSCAAAREPRAAARRVCARSRGGQSPARGGLDVEAAAAWRGKLLLGLRRPADRNGQPIVAVLDDPASLFGDAKAQPRFEPPLVVPARRGEGIRGMTEVGDDVLVILGGRKAGKDRSRVVRWNPASGAVREVELGGITWAQPEGISLASDGTLWFAQDLEAGAPAGAPAIVACRPPSGAEIRASGRIVSARLRAVSARRIASGRRLRRAARRRSAPPRTARAAAIAQPPTNSAGPVLRAGFTEVLVTGMLIRWISVRPRPMAIGAKPAGARLSVAPRMIIRNMKVITTSATSAGRQRVAARRMLAVAVGGEAAGEIEAGLAAGDDVEHAAPRRSRRATCATM